MPEITLTDLIAWEPRLRPVGIGGVADESQAEAWADRELSWAITVRATPPMLPTVRGGEIVLLPSRMLSDAGLALPLLLRELSSHGIAAVVLDQLPNQSSPIPVLYAESLPPDFEGELNRMLTERRSELYRAGTDLGRLLTNATSAGADLPLVLGTAATFLDVPAAVIDARGALLSSTAPDALPPGARSLAAMNGFNRGWRDERYMSRLTNGESLWLGPVPKTGRALARLAAERVAVAAEAALQRAAEARPRGPARAAALNTLLTGPRGEAGRLAGSLALPGNGVYRVALVSPEADSPVVQRTLATTGTIHEAGQIDRATAFVLELRPEAISGGAARAASVRRREPTPHREGAAAKGWVALSAPVTGPAGLPGAAREARYVAALVAAGLIPGPVARFDLLADLGPYLLLYRLWGTPELASFAAETLGELPARDRRGTLRKTLLAYLATGGSHVDAAASLSIHRNTLSYRLKQISALTGREPTNPSTHLVFHLALLASSMPPAPDERVSG
jgi:purine catabolism regulator